MMRHLIRVGGLVAAMWQASCALGQPLAKDADSLRTLSPSQFYGMVANYHPVVSQAMQLTDLAQAEVRMARGFFDPKAVASFDEKFYTGKRYWTTRDYYISLPTWFGIDFKAGVETGTGLFIPNEDFVARDAGVSYFGVTIPVLRGMFMDERRLAVRLAQQVQKMNEAERIKVINKVILGAAKAYWGWYQAYKEYDLAQLGVNLAQTRYTAVKARSEVGDLAIIDSVEAKITLIDRQISVQKALIDVRKAALELETYLWGSGTVPVFLSQRAVPQTSNVAEVPLPAGRLDSLRTQAAMNHPELVKLDAKLAQLRYERRQAIENLKPTLDVSANLITDFTPRAEQFGWTEFRNNNKFGVKFSMPLFLRKERGKLWSINTKTNQTKLEQDQTRREVLNEVEASYIELVRLQQILRQTQELVRNYQTLRQAELDKFDVGESTLFLVNTRESKLLESQVKLAETEAKLQKAKIQLQWAAGRITLE